MQLPHKQRGMGLLGIFICICVFAVFATCGVKMTPHYIDNYALHSILSRIAEDPLSGTKSKAQIRTAIERQFITNRVSVVKPKEIKITDTEGLILMDVSYEVRQELMYNVDVVMKFNDMHYEIPKR